MGRWKRRRRRRRMIWERRHLTESDFYLWVAEYLVTFFGNR
jgi:hypothetical protein